MPDVLVIAESGTDWTASLDGWRARAGDVAALIQSPLEPLGAFARRIRVHVAQLALGKCMPATLLLLGPAAWDRAAKSARLAALRTLVRKVSWTPGARLILECHGPHRRSAVVELRLLGARVVEEIGDPHIRVRQSARGLELQNCLAA